MGEEHVPKVIGKLSRELHTTASIEWDVTDFFGLEEGEDRIDSPEFHFMGAEWCLWAYPYGRKKNNSVGWIELFLVRKNSIFKAHYLECRLGIRKKDGTEYHAFEYERNFTKNEESWGIYKVMKRSELLKDNDQTAAKKSVKFFCRFHAKVNENEVTESQTIPYERPRSPSLRVWLFKKLEFYMNNRGSSNCRGSCVLRQSYRQLQGMSNISIVHSEMTEENTPKIVGKISRELRIMAAMEWEVPDFFGLEEDVHCIDSPEFSFMGGKWTLRMYPYGRKNKNSVGWIELYLMRLDSIFKEHDVIFCIGIRKEDGTEYRSVDCEHNFTKNGSGAGHSKVLQRSTFLKDKDQITSTNIVKIFCRFHEKLTERRLAEFQTFPYENLKTLAENLKELLNGEDCDVVLKVQSKEFRAHRAVLKVRSPVFRSMFTHKMKEQTSGVVEITDCEPTAFADFLHFVYCGKVEKFSTARVFDLYAVADKYDVVELKTMCTDFIIENLSRDTFFNALNLALRYQESTILKHVTDFFVENAIGIVKSCQWLSFQKRNPVAANGLFIKTFHLLKSKIPKK